MRENRRRLPITIFRNSVVGRRYLFSGRRGVGLIGIVIAALILAMVVPPLAGLFTSSYRTVTHSEAALMAAIAASDLFERVTDPRFVTHQLGNTITVPGVEGLKLMEPFATRYRATAVVRVERAECHTNPATGHEETGLYDVGVTVSWEEGKSPHSLETRTLVADWAPMKAY